MKFFNKKMTWGGFLGIIGLVIAVIAGLICQAFGVHKMVGEKLKNIKTKLFDK